MTPEERKKVNPKVVFFAGKAAPGCEYRILTNRKRSPLFLMKYSPPDYIAKLVQETTQSSFFHCTYNLLLRQFVSS